MYLHKEGSPHVECECKYDTRIKGFQPEPPEFPLEWAWAPWAHEAPF